LRALFFITTLFLLLGCSEYNRVLKSDDIQLKYTKAIEYYESEEYYKAYPIIEELITIYRGTAKSEQLYYIYAHCDFYLGDYMLAAHRFKQFATMFPYSEYTEECTFMSAYCHYLSSPKYSLDQTETYVALDQFEIFMQKFPSSTYRDTCQVLSDDLNLKLQTKEFEISKLYLHTENYKAAIASFENNLVRFPDSKYREEISFLTFKSHFYLAKNSIEKKKPARVNNAKKAYVKFLDQYPNSPFLKEAEDLYKELTTEIALQ